MANNYPKSGLKNPNVHEETPEEDLAKWLQHPLEGSPEKDYCSDPFEQWPSASPSLRMQSPVGGASSVAMDSRLCAEYRQQPLMMSQPRLRPGIASSASASTNLQGSSSNVPPRGYGTSSMLKATTGAEGALALGARRAGGLTSISGVDAFSKVRTSMQPPPGANNTPSRNSDVDQTSLSRRYNIPQMAGTMGAYPPHGAVKTGPNNISWPMFNSRANTLKSMSSSLEKPPEPVHLQSNVQESGCNHITRDATVHSGSTNSRIGVNSLQQLHRVEENGGRLGSHNSLVGESHDQKSASCAAGVSELVPSTCSGGSQASADLSVRETKLDGKRKYEGSECQSEDADDESMEIKQPRRQSSSKRNRAAEVHNLSEKNRRNRINEKLKALQDLIPNSTKTDKASVLDEAIDYMKTLQMQLQMVSMRNAMDMSQMMIPMSMSHLQMAPLQTMGFGVPIGHAGMGMGMGMGMMDFSQRMMARPFQSLPTAVNAHFGIPFQDNGVVNTHESRQAFNRVETQGIPMPQNSPQFSGQPHPMSRNVASSSQHQQNEQDHSHHSRNQGSRN